MAQMPREISEGLSPDAYVSWTGVATDNASGKNIDPNGQVANLLTIMRVEAPELFAEEDMAVHAGSVSRGEFAQFIEQQGKAREEIKSWSPDSGVSEAFNRNIQRDGLRFRAGNKKDTAEKAAILLLMEQQATQMFMSGGQKKLTPEQYNDAYRWAVGDVVVNGEPTPRYKIKGQAEVAQEARDNRTQIRESESQLRSRAIRLYREKNDGMYPTTDEIAQIINALQGRDGKVDRVDPKTGSIRVKLTPSARD